MITTINNKKCVMKLSIMIDKNNQVVITYVINHVKNCSSYNKKN